MTTVPIKFYRDLEVWQKAMNLAEVCYHSTEGFPRREVYGLASQIRRAAVSIPSNIAEGHSRSSRQAYLNHLSIALGSQSEVETQIELARRLSLLPDDVAKQILTVAGQVSRMLHALITSLERKQLRLCAGFPSPQPRAPSPQSRDGRTSPCKGWICKVTRC